MFSISCHVLPFTWGLGIWRPKGFGEGEEQQRGRWYLQPSEVFTLCITTTCIQTVDTVDSYTVQRFSRVFTDIPMPVINYLRNLGSIQVITNNCVKWFASLLIAAMTDPPYPSTYHTFYLCCFSSFSHYINSRCQCFPLILKSKLNINIIFFVHSFIFYSFLSEGQVVCFTFKNALDSTN